MAKTTITIRDAEKSVIINNVIKIRPVKVGKKKVKWSEEIDEFLYR